MSDKTFVDTNVLIYAHDVDAKAKHQTAKRVLHGLWNERTGILSVQVLQEFYVNVTRKIPHPLSKESARLVVSTYTTWCIDITPAEFASAFRIEDESHIGFWDARAIYWMDTWARGAAPTPYEPENTEAVNESAKPLCLALPPRDAAKLSLRLAEEADGKVKALSDAMLTKIRATGGPPFNLSRAIHRKEHLDDIDQLLRD